MKPLDRVMGQFFFCTAASVILRSGSFRCWVGSWQSGSPISNRVPKRIGKSRNNK